MVARTIQGVAIGLLVEKQHRETVLGKDEPVGVVQVVAQIQATQQLRRVQRSDPRCQLLRELTDAKRRCAGLKESPDIKLKLALPSWVIAQHVHK